MKTYQKIVVIGIVLIALFSVVYSKFVGAEEESWSVKLLNEAKSDINNTANQQTSSLLTDINTTIANKLSADLQETVDSSQMFLQNFIQNYFQGKIDGLKDSPEYTDLERQIGGLTDEAIQRVRQQIDAAIANTMK